MHTKLFLLAHNIRSLHNVGSFFRTADGFGVSKIYLSGYTGTPPRNEIAKVALGAEESVPWEHREDAVALVKELRKDGITIAALEQTDQSVDIETWKPTLSLALILGHEVDGVSDELLKTADVHLHIPMLGTKESFNVSVAAGIALAFIKKNA